MDLPTPEHHAGACNADSGALYRPIGDYAVIGDGRTAALVSGDGSIDWLCLPHFSGPAVFLSLLDAHRGGRFRIRPIGPYHARRRYIEDSNVLETTFETGHGRLRVTDCMPIAAEADLSADANAVVPQREVLREVECLSGEVECEVLFFITPDYAKRRATLRRRGRLGWFCQLGRQLFALHSDLELTRPSPDVLSTRARLSKGDRRYLSFTFAVGEIAAIPPLGDEARRRIEQTVRWWRQWCVRCCYQGPYRRQVLRSVLTLKLLTYSLSGAVVAAATSSLPETIGEGRNWDYRYCWLRDATLTLRAFMGLGYRGEGDAFFGWLIHATRLTRPELQVLYDVHGNAEIREQELTHLDGYCGSRPVRLGNAAWQQLQLDVYGEVLQAAWDYVRQGGTLDSHERRILVGFGNVVCRRWREPDEGIWEMRGGARQHTHSKLMCWTGLDCLLALEQAGHIKTPRKRFEMVRSEIRDAIEQRGFNHDLQSYVGVFDSSLLDAALLLMPRLGYIEADHPRMRSTYDRIRHDLRSGDWLQRYTPHSDQLAGTEGAFGVINFWAVDYLVRCGKHQEARGLFERLLGLANDVGLYAEEFEPRSGAALGNFPQAFTHVGLVNAALTLEQHQARSGRHRA